MKHHALEDQYNEKATFTNGVKRRHRVDVYALGPNNTILAAYGYGYLDLPGGGIDVNESVLASGMRELAEEAGWPGTNGYTISPPGNWIFSGSDDGWFDRDGWKEEENFSAVCTVTNFAPTETFGSHNDSLDFKLIPINVLIEDINKSLNTNISDRIRMRLNFRLAVLAELKKSKTVSMEAFKPTWAQWMPIV